MQAIQNIWKNLQVGIITAEIVNAVDFLPIQVNSDSSVMRDFREFQIHFQFH